MIKKTVIILLSVLIPTYLFVQPFLIIADDLGTRDPSLQEGFLFYWSSIKGYSPLVLFLKIHYLNIFSISIITLEYYTKFKWRVVYLIQGIVFLSFALYTYYYLDDVSWVRLLLGGNTSFIKQPEYYFIFLIELVAVAFSLTKAIKPDFKVNFLKRVFD